jgi:hypothetical protein
LNEVDNHRVFSERGAAFQLGLSEEPGFHELAKKTLKPFGGQVVLAHEVCVAHTGFDIP